LVYTCYKVCYYCGVHMCYKVCYCCGIHMCYNVCYCCGVHMCYKVFYCCGVHMCYKLWYANTLLLLEIITSGRGRTRSRLRMVIGDVPIVQQYRTLCRAVHYCWWQHRNLNSVFELGDWTGKGNSQCINDTCPPGNLCGLLLLAWQCNERGDLKEVMLKWEELFKDRRIS
jgi:hypothetical protein